jgi:hypothetical protein
MVLADHQGGGVMTPEVTPEGAIVPPGATLSPNDIYYLRSIQTQLEGVLIDFRKRSYGPTLGGEILADNLDWLDCFIEKHSREQVSA